MKRLFSLVAVIAVVGLFFACQKSPEKKIVGTWKFDQAVMEKQMEEDMKKGMEENMKNVPDSMKEMMSKQMESSMQQAKEMIKSITFVFDEKNFTFKSPSGEQKGTWTYDDATKTITNKDDKGKEEKITVKELTEDKMVLLTKQGEKESALTLVKEKK